MNRLRDERGTVWAIAAFFVPLLVIFGTFAVDVGNWFTHQRHLQTQADAAAIAGGTQFSLPCDGTVNTKVTTQARAYSGPSAPGTPSSSIYPTGPFNPQVSGTSENKLHVLLNSTNFYDPNSATDQNFTNGTPCAARDLTTGQLTDKYIDVKVTEKDIPWFFHLVGSGIVPKIDVEARARFTETTGEKGFLPLGLPAPKIQKATATIRACNTSNSNSGTPLAVIPLVKDANQPLSGFTRWVSAAPTFALTKPGSFNQCVGDYMAIDTNVEVSGSPNVTPGLGNCGTKFVDCYQTTEARIWKPGNTPPPAAEQDAPAFRDVNIGPGCSPGTAYWASGVPTNLPCTFPMSAGVDWGTLPTLGGHTGFHEILTASGGGGSASFGQDTCAAAGFNNCASGSGLTSGDGTAGTQPNGAAAMQSVTISWEYWWATGPNGYKCTPNKHCSGTSPILTRANSDDQSTVAYVQVTNQGGAGNPYNGLGLDSTPYDSYPTTASIVVYTSDGYTVGQRAVLRQGISQGNQSLVCDPDYTQGKTFQMIVNGCKPTYGINNLDGTVDQPPHAPTSPLTWEPCPSSGNFFFYPQTGSTSTWYCIPTEPGLRPGQVADGIAARTGNCDNINNNGCSKTACNYPNNWVAGKAYDTNLAPGDPGYDPRVIKIYIIPTGALNNSSGNDVVEVVAFAGFYVTGWNANGANSDPCKGSNAGLNPEDVPNGNGGIAGRFVKIVDPPNGVPNPTQSCDPNNILPCTVVLVR